MHRLDVLALRSKEQSAEKAYLVGTVEKWNDAKRAEERDRVKHAIGGNNQ